jgi:hypothetical protein
MTGPAPPWRSASLPSGSSLASASLGTGIVEEQFSSLTGRPWYIQTEELGLTFVKKEAETQPFVAKVLLPTCVEVTPRHRLESGPSGWQVIDTGDDTGGSITDEEFLQLYLDCRRFG